MRSSDLIAEFIRELLEKSEGVAELQRGELAQRFSVVPSQINYVIETRFSPERGYIVESRRGGGGYIRIRRVTADRAGVLMHVLNAIGEILDFPTLTAFLQNLVDLELVSIREAKLIQSAAGDKALRAVPPDQRDRIRADLLRQSLLALAD